MAKGFGFSLDSVQKLFRNSQAFTHVYAKEITLFYGFFLF